MNPVFAIEVVLLAAAVLLAAGIYSQWRTSASCARGVRIALVALRAVSALALAALALNIGGWRRLGGSGEKEWVILLDRSASMATRDAGGQSRWDAALAMVRQARKDAPEQGKVRAVPFDTQIGSAIEDMEKGVPEAKGDGTDLNRAVHQLLDLYQGARRELAGIAVLSDGRQTVVGQPVDAARRAVSRGVAVTAVPLGGTVPRRDLEVSAVRRHLVAHKGQRLKIRAKVANRNLGDVRTAVRLIGEGGRTAAESAVELTNNSSTEVVFTQTPTNAGQAEYRIEAPLWPGETLARNNGDRVTVSVLEHPVRVLLVEGTPYWDSKFLAQLLRLQTNVTISALYRVSSERSMRIESGEARPGGRAEEAFPADAASLAGYDLIVFGKGIEYFVDPSRAALLKSFVRDQGGAVIFSRGKPYHSRSFAELEAIEPVEWGDAVGSDFRWLPTVEGESAGLFDGFLPGRADPTWERLPAMRSANGCRRVKTFATVLVEGRRESAGADAGFPVLVAMRFGRGLVAAVNCEGLWQWDFFASAESKALYEDFWMQLMQWSVTYSDFLPGYSYALRVGSRSAGPGEAARVRVSRRGTGSAASRMEIEVKGPAGRQVLAPAAVPGQEQRWETAFQVEGPGVYTVSVTDGAGAMLAPAEEVEVPAPPGELDECSADPDYLGRFASESGGRVLPAQSWGEWVASVRPGETRDAQLESVWESRWDRAWVLLVVVGLLSAEWYLRRRNGLA